MAINGFEDDFPEGKHQAIVLVAELDGFAALSEIIDDEALANLVKETWSRLDQVIVDHGGFISQHYGDEVVAIWGLPSPEGDDADKAVTCALELKRKLESFSGESPMASVGRLKMKIGVFSGAIFVSRHGLNNEWNVMGETLNSARRFSEYARPGSILIGQSTFHQVNGLFRVYRVADLVLRGTSEPVTGYIVEARHDQPTRIRYTGTGSLETRMVGRDEEFNNLVNLFEQLELAADPFLVLLTGEMGMGRSRLLLEFSGEIESVRENYNFLSARGYAEGKRVPFFLWKSLWKNRFGLLDDMPEDEAHEKLLRGVLKLWGKRLGQNSAIEVAHFIGDLVGIPWKNSPYTLKFENDPALRNNHSFELIRDLFIRLGESAPVVLMIDDLHLVDTGSLELLLYLLRQGEDALPLMIIASTSPEFLKINPELGRLAYRVFQLDPIPFAFDAIAKAYPSIGKLPDALIPRIIERAGGNPLFLEETVKHIHFSRRAEGGDAELRVSVAHPIPKTISGLLEKRIAQVSKEAQEVLQIAAVTGRRFWKGCILAAARQPVGTGLLNMPVDALQDVVEKALKEIVMFELAFLRSGTVFNGENEYIFKHALLQQVAYGILPEKYRKFYHFAAAKWLSQKSGPDMQVVVADHYEKAGNTSSALRAYQYALDVAAARGIQSEVVRLEKHIQAIRYGEMN